MATSVTEIASFLENQNIRHQIRPEYNDIITIIDTQNYQNEEGENILPIIISLEEQGRFIKIYAPNCYQYKESVHQQAFFQTLLTISFHTKMVQFECDYRDQDIHAMVEFPIEDSALTEEQVKRSLYAIIHVIEHYDSTIQTALKTGTIAFGRSEEERWMSAFFSLMSKIDEVEKDQAVAEEESASDEDWI